MGLLTHEEAFALNAYVEGMLPRNPSVSHDSIIPQSVLSNLKSFALDFLKVDLDRFKKSASQNTPIPTWYRTGGVHESEIVKQFSDTYITPLLFDDYDLIGDTAFCMNYPPHDVHVDNRDWRTGSNEGYVGVISVVIPIEIDALNYPKFYTGNQYFYGPSTRLRNGCYELDKDDTEIIRQKSCGVFFTYDYEKDGVLFLEDNSLSYNWYQDNIDAPGWVDYSTFDRLSIEKEHVWKPGNVIVFDSARIHWGGNLLKSGATYKLGLSLNYGKKL